MIPSPTPTHSRIAEAVGLHTIQTNDFKTARLSLYTVQPANGESSPLATLLFGILRRGSQAYPKLSLLNRRLDELYGTTLTLRNFLIGDKHILSFTAEMMEDAYLPKGETCDILQGTLDVLAEMLCRPLTDVDGRLRPDVVEQEKQSLCDSIRADINDPRTYASMRLRHVMCQGEPYGVSLSGDVDTVMSITPEDVTNAFVSGAKQASWEVYYTGRASADRVAHGFMQAFGNHLPAPLPVGETLPHLPPKSPRYVEETLPVEQGKLCMAWSGVSTHDGDHPAAVVLCELLGVMQSAVLFRTVREEMGLCYYCDASYEGSKGILTVASGIHPRNRQAAEDAIIDAVERIKEGKLDPNDVTLAQLSLQNAYRQIPESPASMEAYWFRHAMEGQQGSPEEILSLLMDVTADRVVAVAREFSLDTVYFLNATEDGEVDE